MVAVEGDLFRECGTENENGGAYIGLAEGDSFFGDGEADVGGIVWDEGLGGGDEAVAVGIGFEDGHDGRGGGVLADGLVVLVELSEVDLEVGRS